MSQDQGEYFAARGHDRRLPEWEPIDDIRIRLCEYHRESDLAGEGWRTKVLVQFRFKGHLVHERSYANMQSALMLLSAEWFVQQSPINADVLALEPVYCDQPGCNQSPNQYRWIKRRAGREGWLEAVGSLKYYRKFCQQHSKRGDIALEDNDENYTDQEPADYRALDDDTNRVETVRSGGENDE